MIEKIDELLEAMREELLLQKELIALGGAKRDALVAIDMKGVEAASRKEQNVLLALGTTAGGRLRLTGEIAGELGAARAGVEEIAARVGPPQAEPLRNAARELRALLKEVSRITQTNRLLTEQSLLHVRRFFRVLGEGGGTETVYTRRGPPPAAAPARLMIDEVA